MNEIGQSLSKLFEAIKRACMTWKYFRNNTIYDRYLKWHKGNKSNFTLTNLKSSDEIMISY